MHPYNTLCFHNTTAAMAAQLSGIPRTRAEKIGKIWQPTLKRQPAIAMWRCIALKHRTDISGVVFEMAQHMTRTSKTNCLPIHHLLIFIKSNNILFISSINRIYKVACF